MGNQPILILRSGRVSDIMVPAALLVLGAFAAAAFSQVAGRSVQERLENHPGLISISSIAPDIRVEMQYADTANAFGVQLYDSLDACFLVEEAARALQRVQSALQKLKPGYSLIVYDCARPFSVTKRMHSLLEKRKKQGYVAAPEKSSSHNYGIAVDLSILDNHGRPLDMGTEFDSFTHLSYPRLEEEHLATGRLSQEQFLNRRRLRKLMYRAGFRPIANEWWHFYYLPKVGLMEQPVSRIP